MQIKLKHSKTNWIEFPDAKFKIGYPTIEQQDRLNELLFELAFTDESLLKKGKISNNLPAKKKAKIMVLNSQYYRLFLRYTIKDWEGIVDEDGEKVECKLINDELYKPYWDGLCKNLTTSQLADHWFKINDEVEFNGADKKK